MVRKLGTLQDTILERFPKLDVARFDLRTHLEVVNPRQRQ
jgi:hypothetical protein